MKILWFREALDHIMERVVCSDPDAYNEIREIVVNTLKRDGECFDVALSHKGLIDCPDCGEHLDPYGDVTIICNDLWQVSCECGRSGLGYTPYEAIDNWNKTE